MELDLCFFLSRYRSLPSCPPSILGSRIPQLVQKYYAFCLSSLSRIIRLLGFFLCHIYFGAHLICSLLKFYGFSSHFVFPKGLINFSNDLIDSGYIIYFIFGDKTYPCLFHGLIVIFSNKFLVYSTIILSMHILTTHERLSPKPS